MPQLVNETALVLENLKLFERLYLMKLHAPSISESVKPGQFVQMHIPGMEGHILRRPFSVYDADRSSETIGILYQDVGFGSHRMSELAAGNEASSVEMIGPVGTPWSASNWEGPSCDKHALLVGGGVGAAPLFLLAKHLKKIGAACDVVLGAQTKEALVALERYGRLIGREPFCSTDDGSYGRSGFATSLVEERLEQGCAGDGVPYDYVAVCGPPPLMRIVSALALDAGAHCEVSLERRMACGIGACLSCVVETSDGKKRVCVDGPVFDAEKVKI